MLHTKIGFLRPSLLQRYQVMILSQHLIYQQRESQKNMQLSSSRTLNLAVLLLCLIQVLHASICGNGIVEGTQECDDGNTQNGDGCNSNCVVQPLYRCDTNNPNVCKIDVPIQLFLIGNHRITSSNTAIFIFKLSYQLEIYKNLNFTKIFTTSIPNSSIQLTYNEANNILTAIIDYQADIENTNQTFQILFKFTSQFWDDSHIASLQLHGVNCQFTFQDDLWMHNIMIYVVLGIVLIVLGIGVASIFFQKWIGLQLIQTYQAIYFMFLLMKEYPFQFSAFNEILRYSNGFDDIFSSNLIRTYTLTSPLHGLNIEKQFFVNFNIDLGILAIVALILGVLTLIKAKIKHRLQSQITKSIKKGFQKIQRYISFIFDQVFIMLVLTFMFKIITIFTIQLSEERTNAMVFSDEINITLSILSFLILFTVIIYIVNWFTMIPDNLTENQSYLSLKFRNMKFYYPVIYLIYQSIFIGFIAIYFHHQNIVFILLTLQIAYFVLLLWIWPYNTPRKINRILHNVSILYNQFVTIFLTFIIIRWKFMLPGKLQVQSNLQFKIYFFMILVLLIIATILTLLRLVIFNKDVQCFQKLQVDERQEIHFTEYKAGENDDRMRLVEKVRKDSIFQSMNKPFQAKKVNRSQNEELLGNQAVANFLNDKYSNWTKDNTEQIKSSLTKIRKKSIKKTTNSKQASLIKSPLEQYIQLKKIHKESMDDIDS